MRKIYILTDDEENEAVADALEAMGVEDPGELENPRCPRCGADTLLAYTEGGEYFVLTWFCLTEDEQSAAPDLWYLVCQDFTCAYEEPVERVFHPAGAELFELEYAYRTFDEYSGIMDGRPCHLKELVAFLESLQREDGHPKLGPLIDEARWRYEESMRELRRWIQSIPPGRRIFFDIDGNTTTATFITAAGDTLLVRTEPQGEMVAVHAESISSYGPKRFDPDEPEQPVTRRRIRNIIWLEPPREYVIVRGHPLALHGLERFGLYFVSTTDERAGVSAGLKRVAPNYWQGFVRRSQVEGRYREEKMVRVKGHWVDVLGRKGNLGWAVSTEDPEVAAALGLELRRPAIMSPDGPARPSSTIPRWEGIVPFSEVEEERVVRTSLWPIPERKSPGSE